MKNTTKVILAVLTLVLSFPAFAQQEANAAQKTKILQAKIERAAVRAQQAHRRGQTCARCGNPITDKNAKCPADLDTHCYAAPATDKPVCARCGNPITDKNAKCPADLDTHCYAAAQTPVCVRCGKEVFPGQHCQAADYAALCTVVKETPKTEVAVNSYFKGGDPHNAANYQTCARCGNPITDENAKCPADLDTHCYAAPATGKPVCARCGNPITDKNAKCPADLDTHCYAAPISQAPTCYRCGKSFVAGQHCQAADYTAPCAATPAQEQAIKKAEAARAEQAAKASFCPNCGHQYTTDEKYHGATHNCTHR